MTALATTRIQYSPADRDFSCFVTIDGVEEYIGSAPTYHHGDVKCNEYTYNYYADNHTPEAAAQVLARPAEVVEMVEVAPDDALPSAPGADTIETTSDASPLPSARQETAHTEATQPAASDLEDNCGCLDPSICWCGAHPMDDTTRAIYRDLTIRYTAESIAIEALTPNVSPDPAATLRPLIKLVLDEWVALGERGIVTDCDRELAALARRPEVYGYVMPEPAPIDGQRIWQAYRDRTLLPVLRDADPAARQRMASAAARFLAERWGRAVPAGAILNNFEWLIRNESAAPAS